MNNGHHLFVAQTKTKTIMNINSFARSLSLVPLHWYSEVSTNDHYCHLYFSGFCGKMGTIYIQLSLFLILRHFFSGRYNRAFELFVLSRNQKDQMEKLLKIIRQFSRFQLNHSPHPFHICSERLWHEKCVVNISREGKKYFPILRLMYFLHSLCTSRLLCELTQWVEYKFHVFGFLPSNSSIHAIPPLKRISLNCIKLTFFVKFEFVFRLEHILNLFVIVPSKFLGRFANQVNPPKWFASLWWQCRIQESDKYSKHATDKYNTPKYKYKMYSKIQVKVTNTKLLNDHLSSN